MSGAKIYIATTKAHDFPRDKTYVPLMVGRAAPSDWCGTSDVTGTSISEKNPFYCELTGQYWIWKNDTDSDIKGLCHYRRYLWLKNPPARLVKRTYGKLAACEKHLAADDLAALLAKYDCLLPQAWAFSADTVRSQFVGSHGEKNLQLMTDAVRKISPEMLPVMERVFERRYIHFANLLVARRKIFDEYSVWLFDVLAEVERNVDLADPANKRLFGYLSERLLNVYVAYRRLKFKELPEIFIADSDMASVDEQRVDFRYIKRRKYPAILTWEEKIRRIVRRKRDK